MKTLHPLAISAASFVVASTPNAQLSIDWVVVANAGNPADPTTNFGAVAYDYRIAATEVTNAQYASFLNAVAASDPNNLYNANMNTEVTGGITRSGSSGNFSYTVKPNMANKPVNYVSWFDAARFCNWLTNGQGSASTETGVYTFNGTNSISSINRDLANPRQVFIPTENEWYKAAYHQPSSQGGDNDNYWLYATQSNNAPTIATATNTGDIANPGPGVANYARGADWNGENGNVTTVASANNTSFYGAFDMNGNVNEWNEALIEGSERGYRGGNWEEGLNRLRATSRDEDVPRTQDEELGFRVATPDCPADFSRDGNLNPADLTAFVNAINARDPLADIDAVNGVDFLDLLAFLNALEAGCS